VNANDSNLFATVKEKDSDGLWRSSRNLYAHLTLKVFPSWIK